MRSIMLLSVLILCCLALLVHAQSATDVAAFKQKADACIQELKLSDAEVKQLSDDKLNTNPSKDLKCFFSCLYKKTGLIDATGKPNNDMIMKYMNGRFSGQTDKVKTVLTNCASVKGADDCETIFNIENCVVKALKA